MATRKKKSARKSRAKPARASKKKTARKPARKPLRKPARKPLRKITRKLDRIPRPSYTPGPAPWFQSLHGAKARDDALEYYKAGLKRVRKIYAGFDAKDGFDIKRLDRLPLERREDLHSHISEVNREMSRGEEFGKQEWKIVRPRSKAQREALIRHTLEPLGSRAHPRRAFIVPTGTPTKTQVRYVKGPVVRGWRRPVLWGTGIPTLPEPILEEGLRAEVVETYPGGETAFRDYIFAELLGWQPGLDIQAGIEGAKFLGIPRDPWEQMAFAIEQLMPMLPSTTPGGKPAYYQLITGNGPISTVWSWEDLLWGMREFYEKGGSGHIDIERRQKDPSASTFTETIIGVRYQGTELQAIGGPRSAVATLERRRAAYVKHRKRIRHRYAKIEKRIHKQRMKIRLKVFSPTKPKSNRKQKRKHK